jgi:hypothetical protein
MINDSQNRRACPRLKANIPCSAQILSPEETFSPYQYKGSILDISKVGIGMAVSDMPQSDYSALLRGKPFTRIIADLPGADGETRIFGVVRWLDYRAGDGGSLCCLGVSIEENPPAVLEQLERALQVLARE